MAAIDVPLGQTTVKVSVIDNGARISGPTSMFIEPPLLDHLQTKGLSAPAYVFLIEHEKSKRKLVFDLGIRREITAYAPSVLAYHKAFTLDPGRDVYEVLRDGGVDLNKIEAVIWRCVSLTLARLNQANCVPAIITLIMLGIRPAFHLPQNLW